MELDQLVVRLEADAKPLQSALANLDRDATRTLSSISRLGDRLATNFLNAATRGENLGSILRGLLADLANATLRDSVVKPVGDLLGSLVGGLFGRASGGSVSSGQPYLVGERGPELFVPHAAGRINPGHHSESYAPSVNIQIDARGADASSAQRLQQAAEEIERRTFAAVFAAMERGGRYARMSGRR